MHENTTATSSRHNSMIISNLPQRRSPPISNSIGMPSKLAAHHVALNYIEQRLKEDKDLDDDDDSLDDMACAILSGKHQNKTSTINNDNDSSPSDNIPSRVLQTPPPHTNQFIELDKTDHSINSNFIKRRKINGTTSSTFLENPNIVPVKRLSADELYPSPSHAQPSYTIDTDSTRSSIEGPNYKDVLISLKSGGIPNIPAFRPKERPATPKENARPISHQSLHGSNPLQHINKPWQFISTKQETNIKVLPVVKKDTLKHDEPNSRALVAVDVNRRNELQDSSYCHKKPPSQQSDPKNDEQNIKDETTLTGKVQIKQGTYTVMDKIGHGGSCTVYRVMDQKSKKLYALKRIYTKQLTSKVINQLKTEIALLSGFNKMGCAYVPIIYNYEHDRITGIIHIVLELGCMDFAAVLQDQRTKPLNMNFVRFYGQQASQRILEAIAEIHAHNIVHRDIKPANIIIKDASLKLIDYGIAMELKRGKRTVSVDTPIGTISYMPPEAFIDKRQTENRYTHIGLPCDIWAFGCILYQMIYGQTPFHKIPAEKRINYIIDHEFIDYPTEVSFHPPTGSTMQIVINKDALDILKICLHRNPLARQSAKLLLDHPFFHPCK